jgi:hypothetical protein
MFLVVQALPGFSYSSGSEGLGDDPWACPLGLHPVTPAVALGGSSLLFLPPGREPDQATFGSSGIPGKDRFAALAAQVHQYLDGTIMSAPCGVQKRRTEKEQATKFDSKGTWHTKKTNKCEK